METKNIQIPQGWEVDFEKSSKDNIVLKEVEKSKYPSKFSDLGRPFNFLKSDDAGTYRFCIGAYFKTESEADEMSDFLILLAFRDAVWEIDEWEPDWTDERQHKYCIENYSGKIECDTVYGCLKVLSFKTTETRDWFLKTHRELIERCKNLI